MRTYIQSGNVLFNASSKVASAIGGKVADGVEKGFGFRSPVVVRSLAQMQRVVERNPFLRAKKDVEALHVYFLADEPVAPLFKGLDPSRSPGDEFAVVGSEVYLFLPNGMGRTKLTNAWFDSKLKTESTARNWRTTTTLLQMMAG